MSFLIFFNFLGAERPSLTNFARIRSYISTCIKHGVSATDALNLAIQGDLPTFMEESLG
jgi:hypothetical protein